MKITQVSTAVLESNFDWTIVKIETDEKIAGYGEAFLGPGLTAVIAEFAEILIGEETWRSCLRKRGTPIHGKAWPSTQRVGLNSHSYRTTPRPCFGYPMVKSYLAVSP